jgi:hypothetical protein
MSLVSFRHTLGKFRCGYHSIQCLKLTIVRYEPVGSRTGVASGTKDGYEMLKVSRDEIQRDSPKIPAPVKNSGDLQILENAIGSCNTVTKVILSALSTGLNLTGAGRFENSHRNDRSSTTTVSLPARHKNMSLLMLSSCL